MGREHDLLDAARTGNCSVIEKIVAQRHKRMGQLPLALQAPLASLTRRTLNINCQDSNGDTPLHLAALNGHAEAVRLLLQHEGSANMEDSRGCFPLHLAAWNGHANICRILLTHGPSIAKVNEQNAISETALHCAAQYGHDQVVSVLLEDQQLLASPPKDEGKVG
ncbi:Ankyrin repeat and sterile alpha motif domain-containing protein 1B [Lamellibrachia satsuma]|nr:Ankyrin repeat and sterile alpha motif domain-containing protein 1B [Lamellibrachia satsuma]